MLWEVLLERLIVDEEVESFFDKNDLDHIEKRLVFMCQSAAKAANLSEDYECSLRLCNDEAIKELNSTYRHKDKSTDVLAFALQESNMGHLTPTMLGDVVISVETAERQKKSKSLLDEIVFLMAHGFCHLLGYDHQNDEQETEMNQRMTELLDESLQGLKQK